MLYRLITSQLNYSITRSQFRHVSSTIHNNSPQNVNKTPSSSSSSSSSTTLSTNTAHLNKIVDDISRLTLLQAADLVTLLKSRLNIQDIVIPTATVSSAAPTPVEDAPLEEPKPKEKTIFNLKIESIEATSKPKIIREVKAQVPNLNLMEAKKFVESLPKVVKENLNKEDAEKLKAVFEGLGAKVVLE